MTVRVYRSSQAGAPVLTSTPGSLIALLDACLVDGYGSMAGSGWTKPFADDTNRAAYRQPVGSNLHYFHVDDNDSAGYFANVLGYEDMTSSFAGTGQFPTPGQAPNRLFIIKSPNGQTGQGWTLVCNGPTFYLAIYAQTQRSGGACFIGFGAGNSFKQGDAFCTFTMCYGNSQAYSTTHMTLQSSLGENGGLGAHIARTYTQLGGSVSMNKTSDYAKGGAGLFGTIGTTFPSPIDGGLYYAPVWMGEETPVKALRGIIPGIWNPLHISPLSDAATFEGTGITAGKSFEAISLYPNGQIFVEISDTW